MNSERVSDILFSMRSKGVKIWAENGQLHYRSSKTTLSEGDILTLKAMKDDILTFITQPPSIRREASPVRRHPSDRIPLSFPQQYFWKFFELEKRQSTKTVSAAVSLTGFLDTDHLQQSFKILINRHEALRTRIRLADGFPEQYIVDISDYKVDSIDLTSLPQEKRQIEARRLIENIVNEPTLVYEAPLFAALLLKLEKSCHALLIATDHMISDAASLGIIWRDLFAIYSQLVRGQPPSLPEITVQYPDYAVWQEKMHQLWMQEHHAYWTQRLAGARHLQLLERKKVVDVPEARWATLPIQFGKTLSSQLNEISRLSRSSLVMSVLTTFIALASRVSNASDITIPFSTGGRLYPEVNNTVGFFGTAILLRVALFEEDTFLDLLRRVTQEYTTAYQHDDSWRLSVLTSCRELNSNTLFNWTPNEFNMKATGLGQASQACDSLTILPFEFTVDPRTNYDFDGEPALLFSDSKDGVVGTIVFRSDHFAANTVERLGHNLLRFSQKLAEEPKRLVKTIDL